MKLRRNSKRCDTLHARERRQGTAAGANNLSDAVQSKAVYPCRALHGKACRRAEWRGSAMPVNSRWRWVWWEGGRKEAGGGNLDKS